MPLRTNWLVLTVLLVFLLGALVLHGYTHHLFGSAPDAEPPPRKSQQAVPAQVSQGGPIIDADQPTARTAAPKPRTIALTFDDGPDPVWTPQVLDVLRDYNVKATFFVVGVQVAVHRELTRRIAAEGHQLGVHTYTHADLASLPDWRRTFELRQSQLVLAGATGMTASLLRPPYSSSADAVADEDWAGIKQARKAGYLTVLTTQDSEDWRRPGVARILANSRPVGDDGQILLMHDAGGDRSQTVAALRTLIPELKAQGFRFDTVSRAVGLPEPVRPATAAETLQGLGMIAAIRISDGLVAVLTWVLYLAGALSLLRAAITVVVARRHVRNQSRKWGPPVTEPVTVVVPAYNESAGIEATVGSLVASDHPVEVIVVDDGSTDGTADLVESLRLPGVRVIRQANAGKPAALTTGIRAASHELVVLIDGDTILEPDAVRMLVQPFAEPGIGAVSGNAKVGNRRGILGNWQHIEYVVGFNLDRRLFDLAQCMPTVPGAIGAFRRSAVLRIGGVSSDTLAEDTDLTMSLCRDGWRVVFEQRAKAWTEAPATLSAFWRQRYRWCYGTLQAMWKHRGALTQRGVSGRFGRRALGFLVVFQLLLPLVAPIVDVFALYGLIFLNPLVIGGLWAGFLALQLLTSWYAFKLDHESVAPLWTLPLQQFVYRQLIYLVVIQSLFTATTGARVRWQRMERYGTFGVPMHHTPVGH
ncbi:MAG TPA: glycosyltransferase [Kribbella sp.]|nr:glycosyltransferase [Kribbella sp.]